MSVSDEKLDKLNQSGAFLQIHVLNQVKNKSWNLQSEIPRIVSPFIKNPMHQSILRIRGEKRILFQNYPEAVRESLDHGNKEEMSIDVYAGKIFSSDNLELRLVIETKSRNPDYVDWCFIQQIKKRNEKMRVIKRSINDTGETNLIKVDETTLRTNKIYVQYEKFDLQFLKNDVSDFATALKKVESKTKKNEVDESTRQVLKGLYGTVNDEVIHQVISGDDYDSHKKIIYIPIVVTNANLFLVEYDINNIDSETGYINSINFKSVDSIIYEYPTPKTIQYPEPLNDALTPLNTKHVLKSQVLIMNPKGFSNFLEQIESSLG